MLKWVMLLLYILLCGYVLGHLLYALRAVLSVRQKKAGVLLFFLLAATIFSGILLPESRFSVWMIIIGNYWMGLLIFLVFFLAVADVCLLIRKLLWSVAAKKIRGFYTEKEGLFLAVFVVSISILFLVYGSIHQRNLTVSYYDITVEKDGGNEESLNMVLVADLHLGYNIGCKDMEKMVERINEEETDLVVLAGDIFDNDYDALDDPQHLTEILGRINSRLGVYAIYGNHDVEETLVGGFSITSSKYALRDPRMEEFMEAANIQVLEDETVFLDNRFYLMGRLDGEKNGYGSLQRKTIQELMDDLDKEKPVFVMNHEPEGLSEYEECGVDVLLSGHTHAGQFFPLNLTQSVSWENWWGVKKIGTMYSAVTSGLGIYGPPIRVGTNSEIMRLRIQFS